MEDVVENVVCYWVCLFLISPNPSLYRPQIEANSGVRQGCLFQGLGWNRTYVLVYRIYWHIWIRYYETDCIIELVGYFGYLCVEVGELLHGCEAVVYGGGREK